MFALSPDVACLIQPLIAEVFVFGVGIDAPSRYSTSIASVNSSFLRRSGVLNADANALNTGPPTCGTGPGRSCLSSGRLRPPAGASAGLAQANSPWTTPAVRVGGTRH